MRHFQIPMAGGRHTITVLLPDEDTKLTYEEFASIPDALEEFASKIRSAYEREMARLRKELQ